MTRYIDSIRGSRKKKENNNNILSTKEMVKKGKKEKIKRER